MMLTQRNIRARFRYVNKRTVTRYLRETSTRWMCSSIITHHQRIIMWPKSALRDTSSPSYFTSNRIPHNHLTQTNASCPNFSIDTFNSAIANQILISVFVRWTERKWNFHFTRVWFDSFFAMIARSISSSCSSIQDNEPSVDRSLTRVWSGALIEPLFSPAVDWGNCTHMCTRLFDVSSIRNPNSSLFGWISENWTLSRAIHPSIQSAPRLRRSLFLSEEI